MSEESTLAAKSERDGEGQEWSQGTSEGLQVVTPGRGGPGLSVEKRG